ncbi:MAG: hypothetical protein Q9190_005239 [Brigantiaea leucoxantha]
MDGLSAAGSIVTLAALAGQLLRSAVALHEFWSSVKDVPERMLWLGQDLEFIQGHLQRIEQQVTQSSSNHSTAGVDEAFRRCVFYMESLETMVAPWQSQPRQIRRERRWRSVKAVLNEKKIKYYKKNLEGAKTSLILAQNLLNQESCSNIESGIAEIRNNQNNSASINSAEHKSICDGFSNLQQDIRMGIDSIPWSVISALESSLPATIHQMLIPMLEQKFEGLRSQIEEKALVQRPEKIERYELGDSERAKYSNLDRRKSSRSKGQPCTWWFIRTSIGSISYTHYAVRAHNEISSSEFRLAFIPHPLLFGRAAFINGV